MLNLPYWLLIALIPAVWFGVQAVLAVVVKPYRQRLKDGADWLRANRELTERELEYLHHLWATAFSPRAAVLLSLSYFQGLAMKSPAIFQEREDAQQLYPNIWADPHFSQMMDWYFASIIVANPLVGILAMGLRLIWRAKLLWISRSTNDECNLIALPPFEAAIKI